MDNIFDLPTLTDIEPLSSDISLYKRPSSTGVQRVIGGNPVPFGFLDNEDIYITTDGELTK